MSGHVFLSYLHENSDVVDRLASELSAFGIAIWLDRNMIRPGERWRDAIRRGIRSGDMFVACFSKDYSERQRTYMNEELVVAIEELRSRTAERTWFVPVSLDGTRIPDRAIGGGETLQDIQWIDLASDWRAGVAALVRSILANYADKAIDRPAARTRATPPQSADAVARVGGAVMPSPRQTGPVFHFYSDDVNAAFEELETLFATIERAANAHSIDMTNVPVEFERRGSTCVIRSGHHSIVLTWIQPNVDTLEGAALYILAYDKPLLLKEGAAVAIDQARRLKYIFGVARQSRSRGWSSEPRSLETSHGVTVRCMALLLNGSAGNS